MRILFITNYFPPSNYGWVYMQLCEEVAEGLADRGHELAVLTSTQSPSYSSYPYWSDPPQLAAGMLIWLGRIGDAIIKLWQ